MTITCFNLRLYVLVFKHFTFGFRFNKTLLDKLKFLSSSRCSRKMATIDATFYMSKNKITSRPDRQKIKLLKPLEVI